MIEVMIVGTFHFMKQGLHLSEGHYEIVKDQVAEVIHALRAFEPTKIGLEVNTKVSEKVNADYRAYRNGSLALKKNEVHQLGFGLASAMDHECLYPVDWNEMLEGSLGYGDVIEAMMPSHKDMIDGLIERVEASTKVHETMVRETSILETLKFINTQDSIEEASWFNESLILLNKKDAFFGNKWLMYWHYRNLNIVSNVLNMAKKGDRILLFYGASHTKLLTYLLEQVPDVMVVSPLLYL